jgi:hypothetical protein
VFTFGIGGDVSHALIKGAASAGECRALAPCRSSPLKWENMDHWVGRGAWGCTTLAAPCSRVVAAFL